MLENENKHISNDKQIKQNEDKTFTKKDFDFRKLEYKAHVNNIARKVVENEEKLGKDNPITCMLKQFYDLQYCLLDFLEMISFDQKIADSIMETMDIVDDAYEYFEYVFDVELQIHGKCKLKTKMEIRKYTRIIQKRMKSLIDSISFYGAIEKGAKDKVMADYQNQAEKELQKCRDEYDKKCSADTASA